MPPNKRKLLDDCFLHDKDRLRHEDALVLLKERLSPIAKVDELPLENASHRFIAAQITAPRNIPMTDNSAVDGYAFAANDFEETGGFFPIMARIAAGDTTPLELPKNTAARIFTGAVMPQGADTIAMQEDCEPHDQDGTKLVAIPQGLKQGANRRCAGEDVKQGDIIANLGDMLSPPLLAAIASTGKAKISVFAPLKVALVSNGNELLRPGKDAKPGQVYDSNHFLLRGLLDNLPVEIVDYGLLADNYADIEAAMAKAASECDIVITSGGASRGEEDHIITAMDALGKRHLWQLAVKPGRPMSFGQIGNTPIFGLPGNPVACFVCFLLYVRQAVIRLGGGKWIEPQRYLVPVDFEIAKKKPDRREYWRASYTTDKNGNSVLKKFEHDGSGLITGLRTSDGLIEVAEEITSVKKGDLLPYIPFSEFGSF